MNLKRKIENDERIDVALLGATGMVGQVFAWMLSRHPWFRLSYIAASDARVGRRYGDTVDWRLPVSLPRQAADLEIEAIDDDWAVLEDKGIKIVFSALPSTVAARVEPELRRRGFYVFSNAGALRMEENVPILIPEVNSGLLALIEKQGYPAGGFVVCNANCSTTGLALGLAPLRRFNIREVTVSTYQSFSGAGYPGLSALDIMDNVIPFIDREEEKIITESRKILNCDFQIFPYCARVPVAFGHVETVWVEVENPVEKGQVREAFEGFVFQKGRLPTLPARPLTVEEEGVCPQPKFCFAGNPKGMPVWIGRLQVKANRIGFVLLVNNIVRGAAGGSIANAETFVTLYGGE
jgi:aspartate-semialdehyde dehydrogenase